MDKSFKKDGGNNIIHLIILANGEVYLCYKKDEPNIKYALKIYKSNRDQAIYEINLCEMLKQHHNII